jgi:hypothetical protein
MKIVPLRNKGFRPKKELLERNISFFFNIRYFFHNHHCYLLKLFSVLKEIVHSHSVVPIEYYFIGYH